MTDLSSLTDKHDYSGRVCLCPYTKFNFPTLHVAISSHFLITLNTVFISNIYVLEALVGREGDCTVKSKDHTGHLISYYCHREWDIYSPMGDRVN